MSVTRAPESEQSSREFSVTARKDDEIAPVAAPPVVQALPLPDSEAAGAPAPTPVQVLHLQRTAGNRATIQLLRHRGLVIQRHPPGTALNDQAEIVTAIRNAPTPLSRAGAGGAGQAGSSATVAAGPTGATATETTPAAATGQTEGTAAPTAATTATPAAAATASPATTGASARAPARAGDENTATEASPRAMGAASAEKLLKTQYGDVKTIVPGNVVMMATQDELWAKYDEICIANNITNPDTGVAWKAGDSKAGDPGLQGFAWEGTSYVNLLNPLITATAHEILHNNAASDFRDTVGESINEGTTEYLAMYALLVGEVKVPTHAYPDEVDLVENLLPVVTKTTLIQAYFKGASTLVTAFEAKLGAGTWATFKGKAEQRKWSEAKAMLTKKEEPAK